MTALFFLKGDQPQHQDENSNHGFKTRTCPPQVDDMKKFEEELWSLVENVRFLRVSGELQRKLQDDRTRIKSSQSILAPADKTRNIYEVSLDLYTKLLNDVTKHYKHAPDNAQDDINEEAKGIAESLNIANRAEIMAKKNAYITLKDHKTNFSQSLPCRLINPSKSEIGKVSQNILVRIT